MDMIMAMCGFASTAYAPAATTAVSGVVVEATKPAVTGTGSTDNLGSLSGSGNAGNSATPSPSGAAGSSGGVRLFDRGVVATGMLAAVAVAAFVGL